MTSPALHDLDQLLAAWAHARRLPDADAERIRQAIVPAVPALSATWWSRVPPIPRRVGYLAPAGEARVPEGSLR